MAATAPAALPRQSTPVQDINSSEECTNPPVEAETKEDQDEENPWLADEFTYVRSLWVSVCQECSFSRFPTHHRRMNTFDRSVNELYYREVFRIMHKAWRHATSSGLVACPAVRSFLRTLFTPPPTMNLSNSSFLVWGAGTDVGKTLICAAYAYYAEKFEVLRSADSVLTHFYCQRRVRYIKPVQTGFPESSDAAFVVSDGSLHDKG